MDAKEYFINAYGIYHTSNVVNEKKVDLKYIKEGYILDKELLIEDVSEYLNPIKKLKTLFSKDDTLYEKLYKTFSEYVFGSIIANREIEHVTQLIKQIKILDDKEMEEFCNDLVTSNKALTDDIIVLKYVASFITVPFDEINNKEIKMLYMNKVIKEDVDKKINGKTLLMYMNYLLTGNTLFINTRKYNTVLIDIEKINMIKYILNEYELELAKNYNTYKNTLLNIKMSNKEFKTNINRITKLSKKVKQKNYAIKYDIDNLIELADKPERINAGHNTDFLNRSLNENIVNFDLLDNINKLVDEKGIKYILKLIEVLERDLYFGSVKAKIYKIRNGKQHFDSKYKIKNKDKKIRLNNILKHYGYITCYLYASRDVHKPSIYLIYYLINNTK